MPDEPVCAGVNPGLLKTPRTQLKKTGKNDTVLIPVLTHSKSQHFHI